MKKKAFLVLAVLMVTVALLAACSAPSGDRGGGSGSGNSGGDGGDFSSGEVDFVSSRKIVYEAAFNLTVDDITEGRTLVRSSIRKDLGEYFEIENDYEGRSYFVARVKSERLDEFIATVSSGGERSNYSKTATDISLNYLDKQSRIEALNSEKDAYQRLLDKATNQNDIMNLMREVARLEQAIQNLQIDLNKYDSSVEYSTAKINLHAKSVPLPKEEKLGFGMRLGNAFLDGGNAMLVFFQAILLVLGYTWPFLILIGGALIAVCFVVKSKKKKSEEQNRKAMEERKARYEAQTEQRNAQLSAQRIAGQNGGEMK